MFEPALTASLASPAVDSDMSVEMALAKLLDGTSLGFRKVSDKVYVIQETKKKLTAPEPREHDAAADGESDYNGLLMEAETI